MTSWDDAADWYLDMVRDRAVGFNHLAADVALELLGTVANIDVLDIGAGEGHVARELARAGANVTAVEPTTVLRAAAMATETEEPLGIRYLADRAENLAGISDRSCDAVLAVLVLHHVADLDAAAAEMRRVIRPSGTAIVVVPHPWTDHPGAAWHPTVDGPCRVLGAYLTEGFWHTDEVHTIRGIGWHHRTLATWMTTFVRHGLVPQVVTEPAGVDPRRDDNGGAWADTPRFLAMRLAGTSGP